MVKFMSFTSLFLIVTRECLLSVDMNDEYSFQIVSSFCMCTNMYMMKQIEECFETSHSIWGRG